MREYIVAGSRRGIPILLVLLFLSLHATAQSTGQPTNTQCKQWDDAYLLAFNVFFWVTLIGSSVFALFGPLALSSISWWATEPSWRILKIAAFFLALSLVAVVIWPWVGFELLNVSPFAGIDPSYTNCSAQPFGAEGLFGGAIGSGVSAYSLSLLMALVLVGAAILGCLLAYIFGSIWHRFKGLYAQVKGVSE
ncbi:MAG: hypothetical protein KF868_18265 [Acidobacteria bacterium]|nr:hypothetical protein [Acidobacteriota bacterium]